MMNSSRPLSRIAAMIGLSIGSMGSFAQEAFTGIGRSGVGRAINSWKPKRTVSASRKSPSADGRKRHRTVRAETTYGRLIRASLNDQAMTRNQKKKFYAKGWY